MSGLNFTVWFTGKQYSGKSAAARAAADELEKRGFKVEIIDEEDFFKEIWNGKELDSRMREDGEQFLACLCKRLNNMGKVCVAATASPLAETREQAKRRIKNFVEVFCYAPDDTLTIRAADSPDKDVDYGKVLSDYEAPENPALTLKTDVTEPDLCAQATLVKLEEMGYVEPSVEEYSDDERKEIDERLKSLGYM